MEISLKKITAESIYEKEKALAESVNALVAANEAKFSDIGYVIETEFSRDSDASGLSQDERDALRESKISETAGFYENGYVSNVKITVKRKKSAEDIAADEAAEAPIVTDEILSDEELELRRNELILEKAKRDQARSVAFTSMLLVRVYKTFWKDTVSISEGTEEISADLDEFFTVLEERANSSED